VDTVAAAGAVATRGVSTDRCSIQTGIGGAVGTAGAAVAPAVMIDIEVDDPAACLERGEQLGATVVMPATHVADAQVTVGWLRDPQDNVVGVIQNHETTHANPRQPRRL
jgi:predicted enzyme related to lactoylglutathione lyase